MLDIKNLEPDRVIFYPGGHVAAAIKAKGVRCLPCAVVDADADMGFFRSFVGFAGVPSSHLTCGTDGMVAVENRNGALGVLLPDGIPNMLNDPRHVQGDDQLPTQLVPVASTPLVWMRT